MFSQLLFLPSIMLSGIMFPAELLPQTLTYAGKLLPAAWGYQMMSDRVFHPGNLWPLAAILAAAAVICGLLLRKLKSE